jgi:2-oxoacid:acceptor oxidoreductase delta subunit (pyruvate/2-ketoisovalerate family)
MAILPITSVSSATREMASWRTSKPVIEYSKCTRCAICWKFCPDVAIDLVTDSDLKFPSDRFKTLEAPVIDYNHCKGCGICAVECPFGAIEMVREEV